MIRLNEFDSYDMNLVGLRNDYLVSVSELMRTNILQEAGTTADSSWYISWRGEVSSLIKNNFAQFKQYAKEQDDKYREWLSQNKEYFDTAKHPPGKACNLKNAPDYKAALLRIKEPITSAMNGLDLKRINVPDSETNESDIDSQSPTQNNKWFCKFIIKSYTGDGSDFIQFAKKYYSGTDKKTNLDESQVGALIPTMYAYCFSFEQTISGLEQQLNSLIQFLNKDPISGQQQSSGNADTEYKNLQRIQNNPNKIASTNPQANNNLTAQQAAAGLLPLGDILLEFNMASNMPTAQSVSSNPVTASAQTGTISPSVNNKTTNQSVPSSMDKNDKSNNPHGTPEIKVNEKLIAMKRKQVACNILKDVFQTKATAAGNIYRDFITTLQTHVAILMEKRKTK